MVTVCWEIKIHRLSDGDIGLRGERRGGERGKRRRTGGQEEGEEREEDRRGERGERREERGERRGEGREREERGGGGKRRGEKERGPVEDRSYEKFYLNMFDVCRYRQISSEVRKLLRVFSQTFPF